MKAEGSVGEMDCQRERTKETGEDSPLGTG